MQTDNNPAQIPIEALPEQTASDLLDRICLVFQEQSLVPPDHGVLVAVSGGPDSMALLDLLRRYAQFPLRAAHLNHLLRPGDCDADERQVRDYCQHWKIPLYCESQDVRAYSSSHRLSLEVAGRELRHVFFKACQLAWQMETPACLGVRVALAHHMDDQAETILLHLGRGSGLDGLTGMAWLNEPWIRPLLGIRRQELMTYLSERQVPWRQDLSNESLFTLRNRLRRVVLPAWRDALGHDPAPLIARSVACIRQDHAYLTKQAQAVWQRTVRPAGSTGIELDRRSFLDEDPAIQSRLLRKAWRDISGQSCDLEWRHIEMVRSIVASDLHPVGHLDWPRQVDIDWDRDTLCISKRVKSADYVVSKAVNSIQSIPLILPGFRDKRIEMRLDDPFMPGTLIVRRIDPDQNELDQAVVRPSEQDILPEQALAGCVVRLRQPGDRIILPDRSISKPLRKYFNEQAIPPGKRDRLPLVARDSCVLWFPGVSEKTCQNQAPNPESTPAKNGAATTSPALFRLEFIAELDNS